jgi:NAD(P)H-dependent FMN reductase
MEKSSPATLDLHSFKDSVGAQQENLVMATSTALRGPFKVGVVVGSQRATRAGPQISHFVLDVIRNQQQQERNTNVDISVVDIASFNLPLTDEPTMPAKIENTPDGYDTEPTRAWSRAVSALDGFVFVTPQYNWGVPAGLKNALDHLFHEWEGKPAMVVSYGGHGGSHSAAALITVLSGMFMRVVKAPATLTFPNREFTGKAAEGKDLGLDAGKADGVWADRRETIVQTWAEFRKLLHDGPSKPARRSEGLKELWDGVLGATAAAEKAAAASKKA